MLQNNSSNIRRLKDRLQHIEKTADDVTTETNMGNDIRMVDNVEESQLQLFFPGKPDEATRDKLKSHGFRWSPGEGAWQRHRSNQAIWGAKHILGIS